MTRAQKILVEAEIRINIPTDTAKNIYQKSKDTVQKITHSPPSAAHVGQKAGSIIDQGIQHIGQHPKEYAIGAGSALAGALAHRLHTRRRAKQFMKRDLGEEQEMETPSGAEKRKLKKMARYYHYGIKG
jgi:hypothetical protein